jgi:hypothetical protein
LSPRMRRHDRFSPRQPPQAGAAFAEASSGIGNLPIAIPDSQIQQPVLLRRAKGEEAASPGNQSRSARFWMFPRQFAFANHRLLLALPQSSGRVRNLTFR